MLPSQEPWEPVFRTRTEGLFCVRLPCPAGPLGCVLAFSPAEGGGQASHSPPPAPPLAPSGREEAARSGVRLAAQGFKRLRKWKVGFCAFRMLSRDSALKPE